MKDAFAGADVSSYDADLNRGLRFSGENREYFARGRLAALARGLEALGSSSPLRILDYGCAAGETLLLLADRWPAAQVTGVDTSESLIGEAREKNSRIRCAFRVLSELPADEKFDLIYCNGVFHHVAPRDRAGVLAWIASHLAPGGFFALWENNSWNPGTRWVMSRVPFDRDAVPLSPAYAVRMLRQAGFQVLSRDFCFFFPRRLNALRPLERWLRGIPLGAQYQVLCRHAPPAGA